MPSQVVRELAVFNPLRLQTDTMIAFSIRELEAWAQEPDFDSLIDRVVSQPTLLAFLISATRNESPVSRKLLHNFPTTPQAFNGSLSARVLSTLSQFMTALPFDLPEETTHSFGRYQRTVELAQHALQVLLLFMDKARGDQLNSAYNPLWPIYHLGYRIPGTRQDAEKLCVDILRDQRRILECYSSTLRRAEVSELAKRAYIPSYIGTQDGDGEEAPNQVSTVEGRSVNDEGTFPYPSVQPMREALYFDSPEALGEWSILISSRADKDLREARRRDAKSFKIILSKIRALSRGHFSTDNQRRLNDSKTQIAIYEATLIRDLRFVYFIDCIEFDDCEKQVIKIFGIYKRSQLDSRFWNLMSRQLARKGNEYVRRCRFRGPPKSDNSVFSPARFQTQPDSSPHELESLSTGVDFSREDLNEVHALVGLGKYVSVSQALLYSIFADLDIQHVFEVSRREMEIIEHQSSCYVLGRSGTGKTTTMVFKMLSIERGWAAHPGGLPKPRQLFVTKSSVLAYKVAEYFSKLTNSLRMASLSPEELKDLARTTHSNCKEEPLINKQDLLRWQNKLPTRFSCLRDDHFPLFVSFDHLCELLQGDIITSNNSSVPRVTGTSTQYMIPTSRCGVFVSYPVFKESYWPHFSTFMNKGLDPFLVFNQFLGVIRGSEAAWRNPRCYMTRNEYENLSGRSCSSIESARRSQIYTIFESYLKQKRNRGDYDAADRVYGILDYWRESNNGIPGNQVDYIYVDEAQDNLLVDALLLRKLCRNPDGLFWAGDTAQTISAGSSFSFNELKSFLFRFERDFVPKNKFGPKPRNGPQMFHLPNNYRSHAGIINCAQSVIEIILNLWPNSIDVLASEKGMVDGIKPTFFSSWDKNKDQDEAALEAASERFLFGDSENHIEFGAQQCIIVRDQAVVDQLQKSGIECTVMTLYDTKGLEFNDVLLYNFFRDSVASASQWRAILNALGESSMSLPRFDETRHATVCSELKSLYVAITRARMNLWIIDFSETCEPMRLFWSNRNLIQHGSVNTSSRHLAATSSKVEWAAQGNIYFENELYSRAMACFEKASMHDKEAIARAYHLRSEAQMMASGSNGRRMAFTNAAIAFQKCAQLESTVTKEYLRASAECYEGAGCHRKAAKRYRDAEAFELAAQKYCDCEMFDIAIQIIDDHKKVMIADVVKNIIHKARLSYFNVNNLTEVLKLFPSCEEALDFTKEHDLHECHINLLCHMGRFADAADRHLSQGRKLKAIELLIKDGSKESMHRANRYILQNLWWDLSFWNDQKSAQKCLRGDKLLGLATMLDPTFQSSNDSDELSMFYALREDSAQLWKLGEKFHRDHTNLPAAVVCFDHIFSSHSQVHTMTRCDFLATFKGFIAYAGILKRMAFDRSPAENQSIQMLFTFSSPKKDLCVIPSCSFLYGLLQDRRTPSISSNNKEMQVSATHLPMILKQAIGSHIRERMSNVMMELESAVKDAEEWSLSAALILIRYIIQHQLPVEAIALCNFIDCICGFLTFSMCGRDAYLPPSWYTEVFRAPENNRERDTRLVSLLIAPVKELMEKIIHSGAGYIHLVSSSLRNRDGFISRIFRALCILGRNIPRSDIGLKLEILRLVMSLNEYLPLYPLSQKCAEASLSFVAHEHKVDGGSEIEMDIVLRDTGGNSFWTFANMAWRVSPTEEEVHAAIILQKAYRKKISRQQGQSKTGPRATMARLYGECWEEAGRIEGSYYQKLFLGPLPHLLLCLEEIAKHMGSSKREVKEQIKEARNTELSELTVRQTEISNLLNRVIHLQKTLGPKADLHQNGDVAMLEAYLPSVEDMVSRLPSKQRVRLRDDLAIAMKGISTRRSAKKATFV